ncbi:hypothetical protein DV736_g4993, partial [Chaetothyriales sp. CBS 134916]
MNIRNVKEAITDELLSEAPPFSFAYASEITTAPNPGLFVKDVGEIGLPLSSRDAEQIIAHCRQSPFGKGSETIVDTSVRNSFELEPGQFELRNVAWKDCIVVLVKIVYAELGLACGHKNVNAELYKLLLYREGAFFKSHQDSEKAKGMFGTLVVSLGSSHEGGSVVLQHNKKKYVYESSKTSRFCASFAAWYSDVFHEVQELTAGYRLVLTYNLIQRGTSTPQQAADSVGSKRLANALMRYNQHLETLDMHAPSYLAYKLEHPYTQESIGMYSLKGNDRALVERIETAVKDLGFSFYLAMFTKMITYEENFRGYERFWEDEEVDRDEGFDSIYDLQGSKVDAEPIYSEAVLLESDNCATDDEDDHESEHEGYTGNEGAPIHRTYRDTMLLIVPPASCCEFFVDKYASNAETILRVWEDLRSSPESKIEDSSKYRQLRRLCSVLADKTAEQLPWQKPDVPSRLKMLGTYMESVTETCLKNNWMEVYKRINVEFRLMPSALEALGSYLSQVALDDRSEKVVYDMIRTAKEIEAKFNVLRAISANFKKQDMPDDMKQRFDAFQRKTSAKLLEGYKAERKEQGVMLAKLLVQDGLDSGLAGAVERIITECATPSQAAFTISLAQQLGSVLASGQREAAIAILGQIMDSMWANFIFERPALGIGLDPERNIAANEIFSLLDLSAADPPYGAYTPIEALSAMQKALSFVSPLYAMSSIFILVGKICKNEVASLLPPKSKQGENAAAIVRSFVVDGLVTVIKQYVGPEPKKPTDFSLPPPSNSRCDINLHYLQAAFPSKAQRQPCEDCTRIISFLASSTDVSFELKAAEARRRHLDLEFCNLGDPSKGHVGYVDLLFHTDVVRGRRPYTWVITKTHDAKYGRDRLEWQGRVDMVTKEIAKCLAVEGNVLAAAGDEEDESPNGARWSEVVKAIASAKLEEIERVGLLGQKQRPAEKTQSSGTSTNTIRKRPLEMAERDKEKVTRKRGKIEVVDLT